MALLNERLGISRSDLSKYLRDNYVENDSEAARRKKMKARLDLYHDRGKWIFQRMINKVFKDPEVRRLRNEMVEFGSFQNFTRRVVDELSMVYSEPARRTLDGQDHSYQALVREIQQDRVCRKLNRWVNLLNECFILFDISPVTGKHKLHLITPDRMFAVCDRDDPTELAGIGYDSLMVGSDATNMRLPHHTLITDEEIFMLNGAGEIIDQLTRPNTLGRINGVLVHKSYPDHQLLDPDSGDDIINGHKVLTLINVCMVKEQKSGAGKIPYTSGPMARTATGQTLDTERAVTFEEGVSPGILDLSADPDVFIKAARAVIKQVAANNSIPESVFDLSYQATSGFEIELKRAALREARRSQIMDPYRPFERELAEVISESTGMFNADQFKIDFGQLETPADPGQRVRYWEDLKRVGLSNVVDQMQELNPELNEGQAMQQILRNLEIQTSVTEAMRDLQAMNSSAAPNLDDRTPEENGESGRELASINE